MINVLLSSFYNDFNSDEPIYMSDTGKSSVEFALDGSSFMFLLIPVAIFIAVYAAIYYYYRNTNKRFIFEHETEVTVSRMGKVDNRIKRRTGLSNRYINGRNSNDHLKRVQSF